MDLNTVFCFLTFDMENACKYVINAWFAAWEWLQFEGSLGDTLWAIK